MQVLPMPASAGPRPALSVARYMSYPGAERFSTDFGYRDFLHAVAGLRTRASAKPMALYLHIPFYASAGARSGAKAATYLGYLKREIEMQGRLFAGMNQVEQLHFGGAIPTALSDAQLGELMLHLRRCFLFAPDKAGEYAIEVDPRRVTRERVHSLRRQGFNRISMGLQCYDRQAQSIIDSAREAGFRSLGIDLDYGVQGQDSDAMAHILASVVKAAPDRIALYNCTQIGQCIDTLGQAGYVYIGMGDFARPGDDLAIAQAQGRLHCSVTGYSAHADMDLVACGLSAISAVAGTCSQNVKTLEAYYDLIDRNELPIERGIRLTMDDVLRRTIIQTLTCQFELSIPCIELAYPIVFADYFGAELGKLAQLAREGLVTLEPEWLSVTANGRILIRAVCAVFARHARSN